MIRVGVLKLIHSLSPHFYARFAPTGTQIDVRPFESPTDGKNAVVTGSVDFGIYGLAAATLGAAAGDSDNPIPLARPRDVSSPAFNNIRRQLTQKLTSQLARRPSPSGSGQGTEGTALPVA